MDPAERRARFIKSALESIPKPHHYFQPRNVGHRGGLSPDEIDAEVAALVTDKRLEPPLPDGRARFTTDDNGGGTAYAIEYVRQHEEREKHRPPPRDWTLLIVSNAITFALTLLAAYLAWRFRWQ